MKSILILTFVSKILSVAYLIRTVGLYELPRNVIYKEGSEDVVHYFVHGSNIDDIEKSYCLKEIEKDLDEFNLTSTVGCYYGLIDFDILYNLDLDMPVKMCIDYIELKDSSEVSKKRGTYDLIYHIFHQNYIKLVEADTRSRMLRYLYELNDLMSFNEMSQLEKKENVMLRYFKDTEECLRVLKDIEEKGPEEILCTPQNFIEYFIRTYKLEQDGSRNEKALYALMDLCLILNGISVEDINYLDQLPFNSDNSVNIFKYLCVKILLDPLQSNKSIPIGDEITYKFYDANKELIEVDTSNIKVISNLILIPLELISSSNVKEIGISSQSFSFTTKNLGDFVFTK